MIEIKNVLSQAMAAVSNTEIIVNGKNFSVEVLFEDDSYISLYSKGSILAKYNPDTHTIHYNTGYKDEVLYFAKCLEHEGFAVYIDDELAN